ncbi:hypothetical protein CKAH01_00049 [Colletotrichum kahawae]|uniref:Uncharacterized protein n=1 Tax=Colletotrichum kahawae TaxID=34407 RepID=A0AAD9YU48_COLKA|nr:hypothetical protein CKAH01_00049 [Colletotrichum kahawae]
MKTVDGRTHLCLEAAIFRASGGRYRHEQEAPTNGASETKAAYLLDFRTRKFRLLIIEAQPGRGPGASIERQSPLVSAATLLLVGLAWLGIPGTETTEDDSPSTPKPSKPQVPLAKDGCAAAPCGQTKKAETERLILARRLVRARVEAIMASAEGVLDGGAHAIDESSAMAPAVNPRSLDSHNLVIMLCSSTRI